MTQAEALLHGLPVEILIADKAFDADAFRAHPMQRGALRQNRPGLPLHDMHRLHDGLAPVIVHGP